MRFKNLVNDWKKILFNPDLEVNSLVTQEMQRKTRYYTFFASQMRKDTDIVVQRILPLLVGLEMGKIFCCAPSSYVSTFKN